VSKPNTINNTFILRSNNRQTEKNYLITDYKFCAPRDVKSVRTHRSSPELVNERSWKFGLVLSKERSRI